MKNIFTIIKKLAGEKSGALESLTRIESKLAQAPVASNGSISQILDQIQFNLRQVENYQPIYGLPFLTEATSRHCDDRAEDILHKAFDGDVRNVRLLDIGASFGYISMYLADRGARATGWEINPLNTEIAQQASLLNGTSTSVNFLVKSFDSTTISDIKKDSFDAVLLLSILHHIIRFNGIEYTKKLLEALFEAVPVAIMEFAEKGEDGDLPWNDAQPENPLDILSDLDVTIEKIGEYSTHLSETKRSLYKISKRHLSLNGRSYLWNKHTPMAYKNSDVIKTDLKRDYYFTDLYFIKKYHTKSNGMSNDNFVQILNEAVFYLEIRNTAARGLPFPLFVDLLIEKEVCYLVLKKVEGAVNLYDKMDSFTKKQKNVIFDNLVDALSKLHALNYSHNDLRPWNVLVDQKTCTVTLIDFSTASKAPPKTDEIDLSKLKKWLLVDSCKITDW